MEYKIVYQRRKTVGIYVLPSGEVEVRAPKRVSKKELEQFVRSKEEWLNSAVSRALKRKIEKADFSISYGGSILFLGREYTIALGEIGSPEISGNHIFFPAGLTLNELKACCVLFYKNQAKKILPDMVARISAEIGKYPAAVKVTSAKTRWGSCSPKKKISLSWRLVMADEKTIEYVIVHELVHLDEMNHSPAFWDKVEKIMPNFREHKLALRRLEKRLCTENWDT